MKDNHLKDGELPLDELEGQYGLCGEAVDLSVPRGETPRVRLDAIMQVFSKM